MTVFCEQQRFTLLHGDCRAEMASLADQSVDSIVCDPPYELGFMGKGWDRSGIACDVSVWRECLRVLKPGGHLLAFGGSRTYHRLACAIEDAGFEIRDQIQWLYGSGFPKSLDVSKAIDAAAGAERDLVRRERWDGKGTGKAYGTFNSQSPQLKRDDAPLTNEAAQWNGWGTALKPAHEPIVLARKPLIGTVAENVLQHGTGGLNIDGCRIGTFNDGAARSNTPGSGRMKAGGSPINTFVRSSASEPLDENQGRWPANVIHDGSDEVLAAFPDAPGQQGDLNGQGGRLATGMYGDSMKADRYFTARLDSGSAARFFYTAKCSQEDRNEGLEDLPMLSAGDVTDRVDGSAGLNSPRAGAGRTNGSRNPHPTVKPTDLMRYLCRLVTPPGGMVCDPFCGSGSTGKAAMLEGLRFIGIELSAEYCQLAQLRIEAVTRQGVLFA